MPESRTEQADIGRSSFGSGDRMVAAVKSDLIASIRMNCRQEAFGTGLRRGTHAGLVAAMVHCG